VTFEWSALLAIAVYALIAWGLVALIEAISPRERAETVETISEDDRTRRTCSGSGVSTCTRLHAGLRMLVDAC
jgi:hypothetical protein